MPKIAYSLDLSIRLVPVVVVGVEACTTGKQVHHSHHWKILSKQSRVYGTDGILERKTPRKTRATEFPKHNGSRTSFFFVENGRYVGINRLQTVCNMQTTKLIPGCYSN